MCVESDDEGDTSDRAPQTLGLSINLSLLCSTPAAPTVPPVAGTFSEPVGPRNILPGVATPVDFFGQVFDEDLLRHIVDQTNLYARQNPPSSSRYRWFDISIQELKAFIGVRIIMGLNVRHSYRDYWSQDPLLGAPAVVKAFPLNRYSHLLSHLHFNDNQTFIPRGQPGHDRLHKVRPILDKLSQNFLALYNPHQQNSIDEAMVRFKGRSSLKQYMPKKPIKRGFKVWCRCDSINGYTCCFQVYAGKEGSPEQALGSRVVKDVSKDILGKRYHLIFDNFFSSPTLASELLAQQTYCTATVLSNRKHLPAFFKTSRDLNKRMERGQHKSALVLANKVHCFLWKDCKLVGFVDTFCEADDQATVTRKLGDGSSTIVRCPKSVKLYNQYMGGVDLADQLRNTYSCSRKSAHKWYMRLFWFLLETSIVNAFILMQESPNNTPARSKTQKKLAHREFRLKLAKHLIGTYTARQIAGRPSCVEPISRFTDRHFPIELDSTATCVHCSSKHNRKRTKFGCRPCGNVHLCVLCFGPYHTR